MKEIVFDKDMAYTPEGIIEAVANSEGIGQQEIAACPPVIMRLLLAMATLILSFLSDKLGITGELQEHIDQLNFSAGMNSETSSCPPSTDKPWEKNHTKSDGNTTDLDDATADDDISGTIPQDTWKEDEAESESNYQKNKKRSLRERGVRNKGKQANTKGYGIHIPEDAERLPVVMIPPEKCANCPKWKECQANAIPTSQRHNVVDVKWVVTIAPYRTCEITCPEDHNCLHKSEFSNETKGINQYGIALKTLLACASIPGMVSHNRIGSIFGPMLGLRLSPATTLKFIHELADKVRATMERILDAIKNTNVVHMDETGGRVNGKSHYIFTLSTTRYTYLSLQETRGIESMKAIGFLEHYKECLVHDCYVAYWHFTNMIHAVCNAHILRELNGVSRFFTGASAWADDMIRLMKEMCHVKNEAISRGETHLSEEVINDFSGRFDVLIKRGMEIHPERLHKKTGTRLRKQGRARNLLERMEKRKTEIFRFIYNFDIPFTNNTAESSFRLVSKHIRCMGTFRSDASAQDAILVWAYLDTARKHGFSYYEAIYEAFMGRSMELIFPEHCISTAQDACSLDH